MDTTDTIKNLSENDKDQLMKDILGNDYYTAGSNLPILRKLIDRVGYVDNMFSLAELLPLMNKILSIRIFYFLASGASILSIFFIPVSALINIVNAYQTGARLYSYRAIAYAITAWAFNKPAINGSQKILAQIRMGFPRVPEDQVSEYHKAWKKSSQDTINKLNETSRTNQIPREALQAFLRLIADNNEQKLCEMILKGFEKQFSFVELRVWRSNYLIRYPN